MINRCTIADIEQTNMYAHKECICQTIAKELGIARNEQGHWSFCKWASWRCGL